MIYRLNNNIAIGKTSLRANTISALDGLNEKAIAKLMEGGAIAEINAPPLAVIPGWSTRAKKLERTGIVTVEQFWWAEEKDIAKLFKVGIEVIGGWKRELRNWLIVPVGRPC